MKSTENKKNKRVNGVSRRDFLKAAEVGTILLTVGGCSLNKAVIKPSKIDTIKDKSCIHKFCRYFKLQEEIREKNIIKNCRFFLVKT